MAMTTSSDVFQPQVLADHVRKFYTEKSALLPISNRVNGDWSSGGSTLTVPIVNVFDESGSNDLVKTLNESTAPTANKLTTTSATYSAAHKIAAFEASNVSLRSNSMREGIINEASTQVAEKMLKTLDTALLTAAVSTTLAYTSGSTGSEQGLSPTRIFDALALGGDNYTNETKYFVCHSSVYYKLMGLKTFTHAIGVGNFNTTVNGPLGSICGMPIIVSDRCPVASSVYTSFIVKPEALKYDIWRDLNVNELPQPGDKTLFEFTFSYVSYLNPSGLPGAISLKSKAIVADDDIFNVNATVIAE